MDAVTYPEQNVVDFVNHYLIPLRLKIDSLSVHDKYKTFWTPTVAVLDLNGDEVQRSIGFCDSRELVAALHVGIAKVHLAKGEHDTAEVHLKTVLTEFADSTRMPEALYFRGVNLYKWHDDPSHLKAAYETLLEEYPGHTWTRRAFPYRLL